MPCLSPERHPAAVASRQRRYEDTSLRLGATRNIHRPDEPRRKPPRSERHRDRRSGEPEPQERHGLCAGDSARSAQPPLHGGKQEQAGHHRLVATGRCRLVGNSPRDGGGDATLEHAQHSRCWFPCAWNAAHSANALSNTRMAYNFRCPTLKSEPISGGRARPPSGLGQKFCQITTRFGWLPAVTTVPAATQRDPVQET